MATGDKVFIADKETLDLTYEKAQLIHTVVSNIVMQNIDASNVIGGTNSPYENGMLTAGTVMEKLNRLLYELVYAGGNIDTIKDEILKYIKTDNTESATGVLSQKLSHIISRGTVKTVQRGTIAATTSHGETKAVSINAVNPDKCVVSFSNRLVALSESGIITAPMLVSLTEDTLTIYPPVVPEGMAEYGGATWQIVEYY